MEWWAVLTFFIVGLIILLLSGFPIAFSFLMMDFLGIVIFMGPVGLKQVTLHIFASIATFTLAPVPLFILMGELMFHSRIADNTIEVLDSWLGRLPGRLSLLAAASGTIFAATSGSTMANTAMLGTVLLPEMKKRGYSTSMSVGPIMGVGGLAMLIPPSALAVVLANAWLKPEIAPRFQVASNNFWPRLLLTFKYLVPVAFIIFMVIGLIILGIATPTEAAASGVIATLIVSLIYGRLNWQVIKATITGSMHITGMIFMIIAASKTFSSILAFTGASSGLTGLVEGLQVHPLLIMVGMQLIVAFMGCFMEAISIMMICLPVFMPIASLLGFEPVWFGVLMLINLEMGQITPPCGMLLFVMKGVAPQEVTIQEICWAAVPYIIFDILIIAIIIAWPVVALWLPGFLGS